MLGWAGVVRHGRRAPHRHHGRRPRRPRARRGRRPRGCWLVSSTCDLLECVRVFVNARRRLAAVALAGCGVAVGALPAEAGPQSDAKQANASCSSGRSPTSAGLPSRASSRPPRRTTCRSSASTRATSAKTSRSSRRGQPDLPASRPGSRSRVRLLRRERRVRPHRGHLQWHSPGQRSPGRQGRGDARRGRPPVPAPPEQAEFHRVADAEPRRSPGPPRRHRPDPGRTARARRRAPRGFPRLTRAGRVPLGSEVHPSGLARTGLGCSPGLPGGVAPGGGALRICSNCARACICWA